MAKDIGDALSKEFAKVIAEGVAKRNACAGIPSGFRICWCCVGEAIGIRAWHLADTWIGAEALVGRGLALLSTATDGL